ncbi:ABC transporter permease [Streptomyces sp. 110]|uniref:ABC transporter permease n=1 Tax=Streptomyces endocoffeicus TaxID=2898945 RepID=A0ABS1Q666_9ACTN|nr:ABC transporter permease [Streptomyces endocoffeicus]MBL1120044.1 ABC transporter permease [Streptomyces endocoffeicus]
MTAIADTAGLVDARSGQSAPGNDGKSRAASGLVWLSRHWSLVLAVAIVAIILLWAIAPSLFTSQDPLTIVPTAKFLHPSSEHWFGTDQLGRDEYARIIYGARPSLIGSALAVAIGVVVGSLIGAVSGWFGRWVDALIMRGIDVVLSIPGFLFAIVIVVVLGFGVIQAAVAVGLTSSATFARLIRGEVLKAKASNYVEAAVTSGTSSLAILRRHVLPNSIAPTVSLITLQFGVAIMWIASLSFLGLGAQPPQPEWGRLVTDGRNYIASASWLTLWPAVVIIVAVLATNHISHFISKRSSSR